mmetsp:Transcript_13556/g.29472  ORF Transcript_13556/g.29472 Transcript_13556/m.29472 type:complete len:240 (+) Transcript_13556:76-795(+)|eukprot:CAMPEP_0172309902 /NCGR_PEP_ID=MMETSP1058-20130122/10880_1 /TAXON_ID=83371 /ORGANISM="Detonula confervacea, Strain CCMP 353" /LENGTH=239 /DNA_ID=CAMNT_0013022615 /DNA_START=25 /DNA_END=744 /DNA_ORIENTATION=-
MADEQSNDFFNPPTDDGAPAFAAPPSGDDSQIGDVYFGAPPTDDQTGDFFNPPEADNGMVESDAPILLGEPAPYEADGDDGMGFAAADEGMGFAAPGLVEDVDDDEEEQPAGGGMELVSAEPTPMAKWNEEWQDTLLSRKEEENSIKASHVEKAREDIAAFQAEREKRRESRMAKNRSDEQDKLEAIEADLENDNSYQRVVKMIELNQDSNDAAADTGRMKDVLVLLKNEPARAAALGA